MVSAAMPLTCSLHSDGACIPTVTNQFQDLVAEARERLHEIKRRQVMTLDPKFVPPLILYAPAARTIWRSNEPRTLDEYLNKYRSDAWLAPVIRVHETFFAQTPVQQGFVLEAGGLDGNVAGSNSYLFERFLGWKGLMVEANQLNFATLLATRPGIYRAETALCPTSGNLSFMSAGCCASVAGKVAPHRGKGLKDGKWGDSHVEPRSSNEYKVRCTPIGPLLRAMGVPRVDFFSLDVSRCAPAPLHPLLLPSSASSLSLFTRPGSTKCSTTPERPHRSGPSRSNPRSTLSSAAWIGQYRFRSSWSRGARAQAPACSAQTVLFEHMRQR